MAVAPSLLSSEGMAPVRCPQRSGCPGRCAWRRLRSAGHVGLLCGTCEDGYYRGDGKGATSRRCRGRAVRGRIACARRWLPVHVTQLRRGEQQRAAAASAAPVAGAARGAARNRKDGLRQPPSRPGGPVAAFASLLARRAESVGTIGKILLAYFQVLHAFSQLRSIAWPPVFASYLRALSPFSFQFFSTYPLSCVVDVQISFHEQLLAVLLLPMGGAVLVLVVALLAAQCTLPRGERGLCAVAARPETCTLQLWLLLLLYPMLAKTALVPFDCVEVDGRKLLRANPAVACDDAAWHVSKWLGGLGTVVYSFGFPVLCLYVTFTADRARRTAAAEAAAATASIEPSSSLSVPAAAALRVASARSAARQAARRPKQARRALAPTSYRSSSPLAGMRVSSRVLVCCSARTSRPTGTGSRSK